MLSPLVAGRNITAADRANPYVALISERTARESFPGENPIGRKISDLVPDDKTTLTVIGVVADARINGLKDHAAMVYLPYWALDPLAVGGSILLLWVAAAISAIVPARRGASTDPMRALRTE
jgi:MacB-like periplasmic core domain